MALIQCPECEKSVSDKAASCPNCGCPIARPAPATTPLPFERDTTTSGNTVIIAKRRGTYIILGILFGALGFHNFYSGHNVAGAIKLALFGVAFMLDVMTNFYTAWSIMALVICEIWALGEIMVVDTDGAGHAMA